MLGPKLMILLVLVAMITCAFYINYTAPAAAEAVQANRPGNAMAERQRMTRQVMRETQQILCK